MDRVVESRTIYMAVSHLGAIRCTSASATGDYITGSEV